MLFESHPLEPQKKAPAMPPTEIGLSRAAPKARPRRRGWIREPHTKKQSPGLFFTASRRAFRISSSRTTKKAPATPMLFWWERMDSNHRSVKQQIYSLPPLATRELSHVGAGDGTRTRDLLITNQLLYQLSYTSLYKLFPDKMVGVTGLEPVTLCL